MTGPAGEEGMDGEPGPRGFNGTDGVNGTQGPQGPAGLNEINSTNIYLKLGNPVISSLGSTESQSVLSRATCDSGDIVIEGGYEIIPINEGSVPPFLIINGPTLLLLIQIFHKKTKNTSFWDMEEE